MNGIRYFPYTYHTKGPSAFEVTGSNSVNGPWESLLSVSNWVLESKTYNEILVTKNNKKFSIIRLDENKHIIIEPLNN